MMLDYLGLSPEAKRMEEAVVAAVREKKMTSDVGGSLGTREVAEWIANRAIG
jgi:isocitrate/isopropylmalate dehydrogenase